MKDKSRKKEIKSKKENKDLDKYKNKKSKGIGKNTKRIMIIKMMILL